MKTRYFKSGILAAAAALLYSAAFVSCTDDVTVGEWDGAGSIETGLNETGAVLQDLNSGKSNTTVELWKETYLHRRAASGVDQSPRRGVHG